MSSASAATARAPTDSAHVIDMVDLGAERLPDLYSDLPVSAGQIRVLDLNPLPSGHGRQAGQTSHAESLSAPLVGTLRVVSLADSPKFTALSYVWGGYSFPGDIISIRTSAGVLQNLKITTNCREALIHLRRKLYHITIWIDAICMNQADEQEKNMQVNQMKDIYSWADHVYIWLGPGDVHSDKAADYLSTVSTYEAEFDTLEYLLYPYKGPTPHVVGWFQFWSRFWNRSHRGASRGWREILANRNPRLTRTQDKLRQIYDATALENLLRREWIKRAWTFQELLLAWNISLVCGNKILPWVTFLRGMRFTQQYSRLKPFSGIDALPGSFHGWCLLLDLWLNYPRCNKRNNQKRWQHWQKLQSFPRYPWASSLRTFLLRIVLLSPILVVFGAPLVYLFAFAGSFGVPLGTLLVMLLFSYTIWLVFGLVGELESTGIRTKDMSYSFSRLEGANKSIIPTKKPGGVLVGVIQALRNRIATEPKDRAFAFYGVFNGLEAKLPPPDYEREVGHVFHQFFAGLLHWDVFLIRLLMDSGTERAQRLQDASTWVPVFHDCASSWLDPKYYSGENLHSATSEADPSFRYFPEYTIGEEQDTGNTNSPEYGKELTVSIQWHGTAPFRSGLMRTTAPRPSSNISAPLRTLSEVLPKFLHWFFHLRYKAPVTQAYASIPNAVFHVLQGRDAAPAEDDGARFTEWYSVFLGLTGTISADEDCNDEAVIDNAAQMLTASPAACDNFIRRCTKLAEERRNIFITSRGYIGSGPDTMLEGDRVALVRGVPVPMLLRDAEDGSGRYTVVGPAFVQGLMRGEDWGKEGQQNVVLV